MSDDGSPAKVKKIKTPDQRNVRASRLRERKGRLLDEEQRIALEENQKNLKAKRAEEIVKMAERGDFKGGPKNNKNENLTKTLDEFVSYKNLAKFPKEQFIKNKSKLFVDHKNCSIIFSILNDVNVLNVRNIKNLSSIVKQNDYDLLRMNFYCPGGIAGSGSEFISKELKEDPKAVFIKEITFKSKSDHLINQIKIIKDYQKKLKEKDKEEVRAEEGGENLIIQRDKNLRFTLHDVNVKPQLNAKSKAVGSLEAHENGFRFSSSKQGMDVIEILYKNIKHMIYQPCGLTESACLIHFNLKTPVIVNKKKTEDIQIFTEVRGISDDLNQGRRRGGMDPDEFLDEQREREMIEKINNIFRDFCVKVENKIFNSIEGLQIRIDTIVRDLSFNGVPLKSNVEVYPCTDCLVSLTDWPPFVLSISEIEICYFERVSFGLKNFDLVFVFKDLSNKSFNRITSIPTKFLFKIKQWLNSIDVPFFEGAQNLNWPSIIKDVLKDYKRFCLDGGWTGFFGADGEDGQEESLDDDSEYKSEESGEEGDSAADSAASSESSEEDEVSEDEEGSDFEEESEEDEEDAWEKLEEEALKSDMKRKKRGIHNDSDEDVKKSKKTRRK